MNVVQRITKQQYLSIPTATLTFSAAVTSGSSIIVVIASYKEVTTVTDSRNNVYVRDVMRVRAAGNDHVAVWRSSNVAAGSTTITLTQSGTGTRPITAAAIEIDEDLVKDGTVTAVAPSADRFPATGTIRPMRLSDEAYTVAVFNAGLLWPTSILSRPAEWNLVINSGSGIPTSRPGAEIIDRATTWTVEASASWIISANRPWIAAAANYRAAIPVSPGTPAYATPMPIWLYPFALLVQQFAAPKQHLPPPPDPEPTEAPPDLYLIPPVPFIDDEARLQEALRKVAQILNSLARIQQVYLSAPDQFQLRGRGLSGTSAPSATTDASQGAGYGTIFVNRADTLNPEIYVCSDPTVGAAVWQQLKIKASGLTGTV